LLSDRTEGLIRLPDSERTASATVAAKLCALSPVRTNASFRPACCDCWIVSVRKSTLAFCSARNTPYPEAGRRSYMPASNARLQAPALQRGRLRPERADPPRL